MENRQVDVISIVVSVLSVALAIYGLLSQPLIVDSTRPTQTGLNSHPKDAQTVDARLWDDPFAVYTDTGSYDQPPPTPKSEESTLVLLVPVRTQQYEEDREVRLRTRFALQRALLDHGYVPLNAGLLSAMDFDASLPANNHESGNLVSTETFTHVYNENIVQAAQLSTLKSFVSYPSDIKSISPIKRKLPIQFFELRPLAEDPSQRRNVVHYSLIAVVWVPDELTHLRTLQSVASAAQGYLLGRSGASNKGAVKTIVLAPPSSDDLAELLSRDSNGAATSAGATADRVEQSAVASSNNAQTSDGDSAESPKKLTIVAYGATIADPILKALLYSRDRDEKSRPSLSTVLATDVEYNTPNASIIRLPRRDDILCYKLLKEIAARGNLSPLHSRTTNVWVFAEWDTLYGRSLADTLKSFAAPAEATHRASAEVYRMLNKFLLKQLVSYSEPSVQPLETGPLSVTVIPYLRGLDGASTLYRQVGTGKDTKNDNDSHKEDQATAETIEPAEGTTQLDYIRRLTYSMLGAHVPFVPQLERPDAIIIFGTDVYDKLVLLKFLRQVIQNCAYFTTGLDALYWHPHYIQYTKNLFVASALPLDIPKSFDGYDGLQATILDTPTTFRDDIQTALYWAVTKIIQSTTTDLTEASFESSDLPTLYRVGSSMALPLDGRENSLLPASEVAQEGALQRNVDDVYGWTRSLVEPITQGASPFWSVAIQMCVIGIGIYSVAGNIAKRSELPRRVRDELWDTALNFIPVDQHGAIRQLRSEILMALAQRPNRVWRGTERGDRTLKRYGMQSESQKRNTAYLHGMIDYYHAQVADAVSRQEVQRIGLNVLSDLFSFRQSKTIELSEIVREHEPEVEPFASYLAKRFSATIEPLAKAWRSRKQDKVLWIEASIGVLRNLFPTPISAVIATTCLFMLVAVFLQPVPFFVGPEARSLPVRVLKWLTEFVAIVITYFGFYRVWYEQWRFRELIKSLQGLIDPETGLSNRQLVVLIADASLPITALSYTPCALVLLLFVSHVEALGGVPLTLETCFVLFAPLAVLVFAFVRLRSTALRARADVRSEYNEERVMALRLLARLKSFAASGLPIQDDKESLVKELKTFVKWNSTSGRPRVIDTACSRIGNEEIRERICQYLETCSKRNVEIIQQLGGLNEGILAPIWLSPIMSALLIPVGGAGGVSLVAWILSQVR